MPLPNDEKSDYFYLQHVTLAEFFKGFKWVVAWWFGLSVATPILGLSLEAANTAVLDKTFLNAVPNPFWIWLAIAVCSWVFRGETITLAKLSFVAWILMNVALGGTMLAVAFLPLWAASPIGWGLLLLDFDYYLLIETGKANYTNTLSKMETTVGN
jgi:hypothetical protein